jgi:D-alanyl-D-alanine dipeptidase
VKVFIVVFSFFSVKFFFMYHYKDKPINFSYLPPSQEQIAFLQQNAECVAILPSHSVVLDHTYLKAGYQGCFDQVFARKAVLLKLNQAVKEGMQLIVFDAYRSLETQKALFESFFSEIQKKHPSWNEQQVFLETKKFVFYSTDPLAIPSHNTGGAVDIALQKDGKMADFGSAFDETSLLSSTDFFEQDYDPSFLISEVNWQKYRENRRILFHVMTHLGFTNYEHEWWHYNLGNAQWAQCFGLSWFYESMDFLVERWTK